MSIRPAIAADIDQVARLIVALADYEKMSHEVVWTISDLEASLFGPDAITHIHLAIDDASSAVVGMALWYPTFSTFLGKRGIWLEDLFVVPEARGGGHGLALLNHLRTCTDGRIEWNVLDWNQPSISFYEALGALPVKEWTRYRWLEADGSDTDS